MTFRERLADWISGGALTEAWEETRFHQQTAVNALAEAHRAHDAGIELGKMACWEVGREYQSRLKATEKAVLEADTLSEAREFVIGKPRFDEYGNFGENNPPVEKPKP